MLRIYKYFFFIINLAILGCKPAPVSVKYGKDVCVRCSMLIMDQRFGAEIVTKKGKVLTFDSIECMVKYYNSKKTELSSAPFILVTDASKPDNLINASDAYYLKSEHFPSPMGENLSAFSSETERKMFAAEYQGQELRWNDLHSLLQ